MIVMLQVNDYRHGHTTGYCEGIAIEGDIFTLHCGRSRFVVDEKNKQFRLGRQWFHYRRYREWVGNWCWDGVEVQPSTAVAIMNWARKQNGWQPEVAREDLWDWWHHDHKPMTVERLLFMENSHA